MDHENIKTKESSHQPITKYTYSNEGTGKKIKTTQYLRNYQFYKNGFQDSAFDEIIKNSEE